MAFLCTNNEQVEFEILKNSIYISTPPHKMKYLGINLTKYVQGLVEENYKSLMKETKDLNK